MSERKSAVKAPRESARAGRREPAAEITPDAMGRPHVAGKGAAQAADPGPETASEAILKRRADQAAPARAPRSKSEKDSGDGR